VSAQLGELVRPAEGDEVPAGHPSTDAGRLGLEDIIAGFPG